MERKAYHDVMPKTPYYRTDGTGRDIYIAYDNGGTFQPMMKMSPYKKPCSRPNSAVSRSQAKSLHYISDGSGRDSYIRISDGGLHNSAKPCYFMKSFQQGLRTYQPLKVSNDIFTWTQSNWQTSKERLFSRNSHRKVKDCVNRLFKK